MTAIKRHKVLFDAATATTGDWIPLDVRYENNSARTIQIILTVGDTVIIEGITKETKGIDKSFLTTLDADDISVIGSYTADGELNLDNPYTYIRARKTGTTGNAKVQGFI